MINALDAPEGYIAVKSNKKCEGCEFFPTRCPPITCYAEGREDGEYVIFIKNPFVPKATGIEKQVCEDIAARQQKGIEKYGTTVADNPLTHKQWLQHAYEEALDMAIYLKRAMQNEV